MDQIITLNVGGTLYTTTTSTLSADNGSMLAKLVDPNIGLAHAAPALRDKDGNLFIDRSGKLFDTVLNYLRNMECPAPDTIHGCNELLLEAKFYNLDGLVLALEDAIKRLQRKEAVTRQQAHDLHSVSTTIIDTRAELQESFDQMADDLHCLSGYFVGPADDEASPNWLGDHETLEELVDSKMG